MVQLVLIVFGALDMTSKRMKTWLGKIGVTIKKEIVQ